MEKTYKIAMPATINRLGAILYLLGLWTNQDGITFRQLAFIISFTFISSLVFLGAFVAENKDHVVFLVVVWLVCVVQICRMYFIIWEQQTILTLIQRTAVNYTNDHVVYAGADKKMNVMLTVAKTFIASSLVTTVAGIFVPLTYTEKTLILPIAFPVDYQDSQIAFWIAHLSAIFCFSLSMICCIPMVIIWYVMLNIVIKFEILGNEFKNLGGSHQEDNGLYLQQLIKGIKTMENIHGIISDFTSTFSNLFLLQTVTSSISICGAISNLAFSSHEDLFQDQIYCVLLVYLLFDIFTIMYLGNEIELSSDKLSYCLFESNWTTKSQFCTKFLLIIGERLKRSQRIIVGKLFPITLVTFTAIVNRAYSLFNILQRFRE